MNGAVVVLKEDPNSGPILGVKINGLNVPIPTDEGDIRQLKPGNKIIFVTTREGSAEIIFPEPRIGCERDRG